MSLPSRRPDGLRLLFVVPPVMDGDDGPARPSPSPRLGFLSLATIAERLGHRVEILDLTLAIVEGRLKWRGPERWAAAVRLILSRAADAVGFTTMSGNYPATLLLARELRRRHETVPILLGGPQASVVDDATLRRFPEVSGIVRGEAEASLPAVLEWLAGDRPAGAVPGLTHRDGSEVRRNGEPPLIEDLDTLPPLATHLYPMGRFGPVPLEAGRGCPFDCTFCTTNTYFRRRYRMKSPGRLVDEVRQLMAATGHRRFDFTHDLFTVDRRAVEAICEALIRADLGIEWGCSARVDLVDQPLLTLMRRAGCTSMFFGIESGSPRQQKEMKKRLHVEAVVPKLRAAARLGIRPTASFIIGFPEERLSDLRGTGSLAWALASNGIHDLLMHTLSPLPGAALTLRHASELRVGPRPRFFARLAPEEWSLVEAHPDLFSSYWVFPRRGSWPVRQLLVYGATAVRVAGQLRGRVRQRIPRERAPAQPPALEGRDLREVAAVPLAVRVGGRVHLTRAGGSGPT